MIAGSDAALLIDAGITPDVARQLRRHTAELTDRPLRYLVNTTYHGDHTFGNAEFPDDVTVISTVANRDNMTDLDQEKANRAESMAGDDALLDAVTSWRRPDVVIDSYAEIELGDRLVELHHFGPGNGPGDLVVHVPSARAAWTGNFLPAAGASTMMLQGGPRPYLESLRRMRDALPELRTIVCGHGPIGDAHESLDWMIRYLEQLTDEVERAYAAGRTLDETYEATTDLWAEELPEPMAQALTMYDIPQQPAREGFRQVSRHLHRLNVLATYRSLQD